MLKNKDTINKIRVLIIRVEKSLTVNTIKMLKEEILKRVRITISQKVLLSHSIKNHLFKMIVILDFGNQKIHRKDKP